jgi:hypothetical protein
VGWNWGLGNTQQEDDMKEQEEEQEKQEKEQYEYMENVLR